MYLLNVLKKNKLVFAGIIVGTIAGYAYYYWIGCLTGTCPITSRPVNSTLYGAMLGGLLFNIFQPVREADKDDSL